MKRSDISQWTQEETAIRRKEYKIFFKKMKKLS